MGNATQRHLAPIRQAEVRSYRREGHQSSRRRSDESLQGMSVAEKIWIGADPGGGANFGIALLCQNGSAEAFCVDCADDAVELVSKKANSIPAGVGIDSPLWWSSGRSGDRAADQWLRKKYGLSGGQVQTANSLRGAALVQGAMFAYRIRQ